MSYCELPLVYDNAFAFIGVKVYVLFTAYVGKALDWGAVFGKGQCGFQ